MAAIGVGKPVLLPPAAFTGAVPAFPPFPLPLVYAVEGGFSWNNRPLSLDARWPLAWTPGMMAAAQVLSVEDYLASPDVLVIPASYPGKRGHQLKIPRAIVFLDDAKDAVTEILTPLMDLLAANNVLVASLGQASQALVGNQSVPFLPGLPPQGFLSVTESVDGSSLTTLVAQSPAASWIAGEIVSISLSHGSLGFLHTSDGILLDRVDPLPVATAAAIATIQGESAAFAKQLRICLASFPDDPILNSGYATIVRAFAAGLGDPSTYKLFVAPIGTSATFVDTVAPEVRGLITSFFNLAPEPE